MKKLSLLEIQDNLLEKKSTEKEIVNQLAIFITQNKCLFGLQNCSEDFISDIVLKFLENGESFLQSFDIKTGTLSSFFISYIMSMIHTQKKIMANQSSKKDVEFEEESYNYEDNMIKYELLEAPDYKYYKTPYKFTPISQKNLEEFFNLKKIKKDKGVLVLAMKSAFYISDYQIEKLARAYDVSSEEIFSAIQVCRESLFVKSQRRREYSERRNNAYYLHRKYEIQLSKMDETEYIQEPEQLRNEIIQKNQKHLKSMNNINERFENGFLAMKPSNKLIAEILGICERRVTYHIYCSKYEKNKFLKFSKELSDNTEEE